MTLSPAESAIDMGIGEHFAEPALPTVGPDLHPLRALEDAIRPGLQRPPCLVMFSGGRDSSALLAVAASLARREGLPLPIAATQVFSPFPRTNERRWQELVIDHLRLPDWQRMACGTELNLLGPFARRILNRHGLLAPSGCHVFLPMLDAAGEGTVLTGIEGDGLLSGGSSRLPREVLARRTPPTPRRLLSVARSVAPGSVRRRRALQQSEYDLSWVRPGVAYELVAADAAETASEPLRWDRRVRWWARRRYVIVVRQALDIVASGTGARMLHPLLDPTFLAALARWGGALGRGDRTAVMRALFGALLPTATVERTDKGDFTSAYWSGDVRTFVAGWDGTGLDESLVAAEALTRTWAEPEPDARTGLLLQAAWLSASVGGDRKQPVNCRLQRA